MKGKTEYGEYYSVVQMEDNVRARTLPIQLIRRRPDGSEVLSSVYDEVVEDQYTTAEEAIDRALELYELGELVKIEYMPDGRGGHQGPAFTLVEARILKMLVTKAIAKGQEGWNGG